MILLIMINCSKSFSNINLCCKHKLKNVIKERKEKERNVKKFFILKITLILTIMYQDI